MNCLVTGANGQLGREMRIVSGSSSDRFFFSDIASADGLETCMLDITDSDAVISFVSSNHIDVIINCAGYTNVEAAEDNPDPAYLLNEKAPLILAEAMKATSGLLIHISTDYVFGGRPHSKPVSETEIPCPTGVYGLSKMRGEQALLSSGCRCVIIRTAWLYSEFCKNFVKTMLSLTSSKASIKVVDDQIGTPTYALDLARLIIRIISDPVPGIFNYTNEGQCSWYAFSRAIASLSGHSGCRINPCKSGEFPTKVVRPAYSVLDKSKVKVTYGVTIPAWEESLKVCLSNMNQLV